MTDDAVNDPKAVLHRYLVEGREALLWKLDGLGEHDLRRPLTATGTNLLGLVKHVASVELDYLGEVFGRPSDEPRPWMADDAAPNADMWATADESRADIVDFYRRVWAHGDATIAALPLDAVGSVPWWPAAKRTVTLQRILVHVVAETHRHVGHADIVREMIDGSVGLRVAATNIPPEQQQWWEDYRKTLQDTADRFRDDR